MSFPRAEFWRLWGVFGAGVALVVGGLYAMDAAHGATMRASFYGAESGRVTASGRRFDPHGMTAAHRSLPFGTRLRVCLAGCAVVTVTDRGPFVGGRDLDLSHGAASAIGLDRRGVAVVDVALLGSS